MKKAKKIRAVAYGWIWLTIIFITSSLLYFAPQSRKIVLFIFPHEILEPLKFWILPVSSSPDLYTLPIFSFLFAIFLFIALLYFRNRNNGKPLKVACYIFLVSMLLAVPYSISDYNTALKAYNNYHPSNQTGLLGLVENFFNFP